MARRGGILRRIGIALLGIAALGAAGVGWMVVRKPAQRPPSTARVEATPERVARGKYLVEYLADCMGCHSDRDFSLYGGPVVAARRGAGGAEFDEEHSGVPGLVCAQNITSDPETGLGKWSDGEIARAIREGVDRDGDALFPMMPYAYYRALADDDVDAMVAYLRTVPPVKNAVTPRRLRFPVSVFVKSGPKPLEARVEVPDDDKDHLGYGKYLVTVGACRECHSEHDARGGLVRGREFAGGWKMVGPWGAVVTSNLTPDPSTFVGRSTREQFIARFKAFTATAEAPSKASPGSNTVMPWLPLSHLTERDLGAMFDYLRSLAPIAPR